MPSNLPPTIAKWSDIWAGGVAVNTMCVQHGFTGTAQWFGGQSLGQAPLTLILRLHTSIVVFAQGVVELIMVIPTR